MFVLASCQFFHWTHFDVMFLFFQMEPFEHPSMRGRLSPKNGMAFEVCRISTTVFCTLFIVYVMFMYICFSCFTISIFFYFLRKRRRRSAVWFGESKGSPNGVDVNYLPNLQTGLFFRLALMRKYLTFIFVIFNQNPRARLSAPPGRYSSVEVAGFLLGFCALLSWQHNTK